MLIRWEMFVAPKIPKSNHKRMNLIFDAEDNDNVNVMAPTTEEQSRKDELNDLEDNDKENVGGSKNREKV
ncbi:hypothetical protein HAX54_020407 [Datura stramonium]|uniref:Uncharacterized protein n=1 Tax=Datura stramonium TaxID=4076 RepID=A0ABS8UR14_DATST|nr:hypothetical protein [Datura stramonium]